MTERGKIMPKPPCVRITLPPRPQGPQKSLKEVLEGTYSGVISRMLEGRHELGAEPSMYRVAGKFSPLVATEIHINYRVPGADESAAREYMSADQQYLERCCGFLDVSLELRDVSGNPLPKNERAI